MASQKKAFLKLFLLLVFLLWPSFFAKESFFSELKLKNFFSSQKVLAASQAIFYFSPSSGEFALNENFSLTVYVRSQDQALNALSGEIVYPGDKLDLVSISKSGSIVNFWVKEPTKENGKVSFEGVVLNPGYQGSAGKILTLNFKAKNLGPATISFSSGMILANDGKGTNITGALPKANLTIITSEVKEAKEAAKTKTITTGALAPSLPPKPEIKIEGKEGENFIWTKEKKIVLSWALPSGVTGVSFVLDKNETTEPDKISEGLLKSYQLTLPTEGKYYFHLKFKNRFGWGETGHFAFWVDLSPPENFKVQRMPDKDLPYPEAKFTLEAVDRLSGLDHFDIKIDQGETVSWPRDGGIYQTPTLEPGYHRLSAWAYDQVGNASYLTFDFEVQSLKPPSLEDLNEQLLSGEPILVKGRTYPNKEVTIWLKNENGKTEKFSGTSDNLGNFEILIEKRLAEGNYTLWAEVKYNEQLTSQPSEIKKFEVSGKKIVWERIWFYLALGLIVVLIFLILTFWQKQRKNFWQIVEEQKKRRLLEEENLRLRQTLQEKEKASAPSSQSQPSSSQNASGSPNNQLPSKS